AAAAAFCSGVTNWGVQGWPEDPSYKMWMVGARSIGGVMAAPAGMNVPPHWMMYVAVPDVDASVRQAEGLGAKVMKPADNIPKVGRFAILNDPAGGAAFTVFKGEGGMPGIGDPPAGGDLSW